ncbi:hypothetical protein BJV82DRAFT_617170 [Fennellomyces sp. T-0311]|nr:hypothetical protein BJV82DRAFT_617170 [Fennellomyces sp. T-0311]
MTSLTCGSLHGRILQSLSNVLADSRSAAADNEIELLLASCPSVPMHSGFGIFTREDAPETTVGTMTIRDLESLRALVNFACTASELDPQIIVRLIAYIRYLPVFQWQEPPFSLSPLPALVDTATYTLASGLLELAYKNPVMEENINAVLWALAETITELILQHDVDYTISFALPAFAGLLRAYQLSRYIFRPDQFMSVWISSHDLINDNVLDAVRKSISACLESDTADMASRHILSNYWNARMPLSSNRMICDLLIIWRNCLARIVSNCGATTGPQEDRFCPDYADMYLTTRIKEPWTKLMERTQHDTPPEELSRELVQKLNGTYVMSLGYYVDAKDYLQEHGVQGKDGYMREIMGLGLHVAALASVYLHQVDDVLIKYINESLFDHTLSRNRDHPWICVAALDAAALIAINFPQKTGAMINIISHFLATSNLTFLELPFCSGQPKEKRTIRQFAIVRLAQCVQSRPPSQRSQAAISTLYALLNEITQYDDEREQNHEAMEIKRERQRQQMAAIIGIAVHLRDDEISAQAFSMVLLRRNLLSAAVASPVMTELVEMALISPPQVFNDIINLFSILNRESLTGKGNEYNEKVFSSVLQSQLDLARGIHHRPEFYESYLCNILTLFVDNGILIQHMINKQSKDNKKESEEDAMALKARLGRLLPVLQALLEHEDFKPHLSPSEELVTLFRNTWLQCVFFGFTVNSMWEWRDAMQVIASKSPALMIETDTDHLETDLEYNSVLSAGGVSQSAANSMRQRLQAVLIGNLYDIKGFSFAQVVFTLSIYHVETMRGHMGDCSYILRYFMSDAVSSNTPLDRCLQSITNTVVDYFIRDASQKASMQSLERGLYEQMSELLKLCCHRLSRVHVAALTISNKLVNTFPQIFAEKSLITLLLELVQLTWLSCEAEYRDEYTPVFRFTSARARVTLELGDSYVYRKQVCTSLYDHAKRWLQLSMDLAPLEVTGLLQDYLAEFDRFEPDAPIDVVHLGRSLALDIGKAAAKNQLSVDFVPRVPGVEPDDASDFVYGFTSRRYYTGEINGMSYIAALDRNEDKLPGLDSHSICDENQEPFQFAVLQEMFEDAKNNRSISTKRLSRVMLRTAAAIVSLKKVHPDLVSYLVRIPVRIFTPESIEIATGVWNWVLVERPDVEKRLMVEMLGMWRWAHRHRKGLFSPRFSFKDPFENNMTYKPSDRPARQKTQQEAGALFAPHIKWITFLQSRLNAIRHHDKYLVGLFMHLLEETFRNSRLISSHSLSRQPRFHLILLGLRILQTFRMEAVAEHKFRTLVYESAFCWFSMAPVWHYGSRKSRILQEYKLLSTVYHAVSRDTPQLGHILTSSPLRSSTSEIGAGLYKFVNDKTKDDIVGQHIFKRKLLLLFLESELSRLSVWCNPLNDMGHGHPPTFVGTVEKSLTTDDMWKSLIRFAWEVSPKLVIQLNRRFTQPIVYKELHQLIANNTRDAVDIPEALVLLLGDGLQPDAKLDLTYLQYWIPVCPITATNYFLPAFKDHPSILQYAMRSLEYYPVDLVFFYVPQIVQALRYDDYGYVEKYIMEAGQESQLFAHQIIWNMQANYYLDADKGCEKPDPLKPTLERIVKQLVDSFTGKDREFYEREFKFFNNVTAISGYLKEYIKYGQNEKKPKQKQRLDEEMAKIEVEPGVYLPSNPDGELVDIDRKSGKPLQSHAKAPFMATFEIKKDDQDVRLSAIFKVGDDCRQDVLALQLIAVFKNIFTSVGLDLYLYPYRVVATAPGQGVIDVITNAISRDQLGREKVNSMYDYFVAKYGGPDAIRFQEARTNFVQSLAAYSVLSYILQFKDRHNGNIMLDDDGHILHIDFGFIFDIAPGGITFESSPFKLTTEMIQVMGGGADEQAFRQFSELVVKAYLASRPYADQICEIVRLMLESGLPCFKEGTLRRLRTRFQLDKSERIAANFIMMRIRDSFENQRTVMYDYFQKLTNGIPY